MLLRSHPDCSSALLQVIHRNHIWVLGIEIRERDRVLDPACRSDVRTFDAERTVPDVLSTGLRFGVEVRHNVRMLVVDVLRLTDILT